MAALLLVVCVVSYCGECAARAASRAAGREESLLAGGLDVTSLLQSPAVRAHCAHRALLCGRAAGARVCAARLPRGEGERGGRWLLREFRNWCELFLANMCDHPQHEFHIVRGGQCSQYTAQRRTEPAAAAGDAGGTAAVDTGDVGTVDTGGAGAVDTGGAEDVNAGGAGDVDAGGTGDVDAVGAGDVDTGGAGDVDTGRAGEVDAGGAGDVDTGGAGDVDTGGAGDVNAGGAGDVDAGGTGDVDAVGAGDVDTGGAGDVNAGEAGDADAGGVAAADTGGEAAVGTTAATGTEPADDPEDKNIGRAQDEEIQYSWDSNHTCPVSCPDIYQPICIIINKGSGKYMKTMTFVNHCFGDLYYCEHREEFSPPPDASYEDVNASPLSWTFCGASRFVQFARFSEVASSMGYYGWLAGDYKYSHIMEPHQRNPKYG